MKTALVTISAILVFLMIGFLIGTVMNKTLQPQSQSQAEKFRNAESVLESTNALIDRLNLEQ